MTDFTDLLDGYQRFRTSEYRRHRDRWSGLSEGQSPRVMVIACSDSRVDPAQIFDTVPGEIFVVRNVANLVPPFEDDASRHGVSAALEFAVNQLEVPEILVLGHGACGGVGAALSQRFKGAANGEGGFIAHWVDMLDAAREQVVAKYGTGPEAVRALELETVRVSLTNLTTFPFVSKRLAEGRLKIHGAYFAIADGVLHVMGDDGEFAPA
ncbi:MULTISPECIES: carbonic anhydrase [Sphingomonas]|jgi:carbonic anhydrase|uniref:Carbonic anhydrase n=1 Tax=Sphingomonas kyeonggiensis TaxID=1268553 RepID=A0A7W7K0M1_9SPHN|nr:MULTISPECIES: carbonic anhydrase [Sphingomonas]MBB4838823.1 carbonic anhydrase [Sphingomonas kyeonggiensis]WHU03950.1 carbonic anhydrase [Sphingomonas sp. NIBR02145]